jgi:16S rRNA (cytidine1402-2'-O)-methyltransferase
MLFACIAMVCSGMATQDKPTAEPRAAPHVPSRTLYLVATPIGNLEDITLRALRVLREADLIACEDTRQTQKLLNHYRIPTQTTAYQEHNEMRKAPELVRKLDQGARIALVSDAGMPGISDPGYRLVQLCIRHGIAVVPVPGPSAVLAALVASGLPTHSFQFGGFLPPKGVRRRKALEQAESFPGTTILFEAPHRIVATLREMSQRLSDRPVVVAREITKLHEEFLRGSCLEVLEALQKRPKILGEMTVLIGGAEEAPASPGAVQSVRERVQELMEQKALSRMEALKAVARERHISKSQAYREYQS